MSWETHPTRAVTTRWHIAMFMHEEWSMLWRNVLDGVALEAAMRSGRRQGAMHVNARAMSLIKRLTRALDVATDPFGTDEARIGIRMEFGL